MAGGVRRVANLSEFRAALKDGVDEIVITDASLARNVKIAKGVKKGFAVAALAGAGVVAVNAWNPAGWAVAGIASGLSAAGASVAITAIVALAGLGTVFMVMYNDYELETKGKGMARASANATTGSGDMAPSTSVNKSAGGGFEFKLTRRKSS